MVNMLRELHAACLRLTGYRGKLLVAAQSRPLNLGCLLPGSAAGVAPSAAKGEKEGADIPKWVLPLDGKTGRGLRASSSLDRRVVRLAPPAWSQGAGVGPKGFKT